MAVVTHHAYLAAEPAVATAADSPVLSFAWLLFALPLAGAAILLLGGRRTDKWGHLLGTLLPVASFVLAALILFDLLGRAGDARSVSVPVYEWFTVGGFSAGVDLLVDPLSISFALLITFVGSLIHVYSIGYMAEDPGRRRFFAYLNLFVAAMLVLVLADNFVLLFLGWEGVGLASYLLIGFWQYKPSAATAAKKAFLINRVGDLGLLVAMMIMFAVLGAVSFSEVFAAVPGASDGILLAIGLLLLLGACGKSAQLPLQAWLLDAMEGPTPVSALIHAATMVTAGVYLIVRAGPIFEGAPVAQTAVVTVGAATMLAGGIIASAKDDIKKSLAGSTMSQIGMMVLAAGLGPVGYVAAIAHLITHGFFKAGLFLGAGSVMHAMNEGVDMRRYGGLAAKMPITFATFGVGYLAIIGVPLLSGWWTKESIISATFGVGGTAGLVLGSAVILGALLTAFYMSRMVFMTFLGKPRWEEGVHPHESPASMTVPMVLLAIGSLALGAFLMLGDRFATFLAPATGAEVHHFDVAHAFTAPYGIAALVVLVLGVAAAWAIYLRKPVAETAPKGNLVTVAASRELYGNEINEGLVMRPGQVLTKALAVIEDKVIDAAVHGLGAGVRDSSSGLGRAQTGFARSYALTMLFGAVIVAATLAVRL